MENLTGRTAVVIGGAGGVGRGICLGLAAEGVRVVVADIETGAAGAVAAEIGERGGTAVAHQVDSTSRESLRELAGIATEQFGGVHVLCNTVGVIADRTLDSASDNDWAWVLEFNILALVRAVDEFLPFLRAHGEPAHIVNTSSMAGLLVIPPELTGGVHTGLYTTTKHALIGWSSMLRAELAPEGIGVSVLCPGVVVGNLAATSARNRPERFGGPASVPDASPMPFMMPSEDVGPRVVAGIRANREHIFTHTDGYIADMLRARFDAMITDFTGAAAEHPMP